MKRVIISRVRELYSSDLRIEQKQKTPAVLARVSVLGEVPSGFEPLYELLQSSA